MKKTLENVAIKENLIERNWRGVYLLLTEAEKRKKSLEIASSKLNPEKSVITYKNTLTAVDEASKEIITTREQLLKLQQDRDQCKKVFQSIQMRLRSIVAQIRRESNLDEMQKNATERTLKEAGVAHLQRPFIITTNKNGVDLFREVQTWPYLHAKNGLQPAIDEIQLHSTIPPSQTDF